MQSMRQIDDDIYRQKVICDVILGWFVPKIDCSTTKIDVCSVLSTLKGAVKYRLEHVDRFRRGLALNVDSAFTL